jgi:hypothetical protein
MVSESTIAIKDVLAKRAADSPVLQLTGVSARAYIRSGDGLSQWYEGFNVPELHVSIILDGRR